MPRWKSEIKIKHLISEDESLASLQQSMGAIADVLEKSGLFIDINFDEWRNIPDGDAYFSPLDYANKMFEEMYDTADAERIWIA